MNVYQVLLGSIFVALSFDEFRQMLAELRALGAFNTPGLLIFSLAVSCCLVLFVYAGFGAAGGAIYAALTRRKSDDPAT